MAAHMLCMNQNRELKGRPTAGRFAAATHEEAGVTLTAEGFAVVDPFETSETVSGYRVDRTGTMASATVAPEDGSLLSSLQAQLGSDDLQIQHCMGNWVLVTAADNVVEGEPVNEKLSRMAATLGLRQGDPMSPELKPVRGQGVFLTMSRRTGALDSLHGMKEKLLLDLYNTSTR